MTPHYSNDRPAIIMNMAMTLDGKSVLQDGHWHSITSAKDRLSMDQIRASVDGIMMGSHSLRQDNAKLYDRRRPHCQRQPQPIIFSQTGKLPRSLHLFAKPHPEPIIVGPAKAQSQLRQSIPTNYTFYEWSGWQDLRQFLCWIHNHIQAKRLLLEGGPKINAQFSQKDLIDEIYITIAPVISAAQRDGPIGPALSKDSPEDSIKKSQEPLFQAGFALISHKSSNNEVFLHYQKQR